MRGDETVIADARGDLERDADIHILNLLLNRIHTRQRDGSEDRQRVAGDDLGGGSALRGNARLGKNAAVAFGDLGRDRHLKIDGQASVVGGVGNARKVTTGVTVRDGGDLVVRVVE